MCQTQSIYARRAAAPIWPASVVCNLDFFQFLIDIYTSEKYRLKISFNRIQEIKSTLNKLTITFVIDIFTSEIVTTFPLIEYKNEKFISNKLFRIRHRLCIQGLSENMLTLSLKYFLIQF